MNICKFICKLFKKKDALPFERGSLVKFRCRFDGRVRCSWDGIYHGNYKFHSVGRRKRGEWEASKLLLKEDEVSKIPHGWLIVRSL